jgi:hypothetical protein
MDKTPYDCFLDAVCARVRFRPVREGIKAELRGHMEDRTEALVAQGIPEPEAMAQAVAAMGDPAEVGKELDKAHPCFWSYLYLFLKPVTILVCVLVFGPCLVVSAVMAYHMAVPMPVYDSESALVRYAEPNLRLTIGDHHITIPKVYQLENGTVHVEYTDLICPVRAYSHSVDIRAMDENGDWSGGGGEASISSNGVVLFTRGQWRYDDPPAIVLEHTIALEEVNEP